MSDLLPDEDAAYLDSRGLAYEAAVEGGFVSLVIKEFELPPGYEPRAVDLLLRLPAQFPDVAPDMFWTSPHVRHSNGSVPQATEVVETYLGRSWQRWSRHFTDSRWRSDRDNVRSYLRLIRTVLEREALPLAA